MRTDLRDENLAYVRRHGNGCWFSSVYLTLVAALKNKTQYVCKVQSSSIKFALPLSLKCFLGRCGHSPQVYWWVCVCTCLGRDSNVFLLLLETFLTQTSRIERIFLTRGSAYWNMKRATCVHSLEPSICHDICEVNARGQEGKATRDWPVHLWQW